MYYRLQASSLKGNLDIPPSKSHSLRAILFASLADGKSTIYNALRSPDTEAMIQACTALGALIKTNDHEIVIQGVSGKPTHSSRYINAGNSGQVLRFITAIAALSSGQTLITGDRSLCKNRPIKSLRDGLNQLKALAISTQENDYAPILIQGPLHAGEVCITGEDSQPVSALLMATAFVQGESKIHVTNPGEKPWVDLTLSWFDRLGIPYQRQDYTHYTLAGNSSYPGFEYTVPGDFSSAAFTLIAALITHSEITLNHLDMNDSQDDKAIIPLLEKMGAQITELPDELIIQSSALTGAKLDSHGDHRIALSLAVAALAAEGESWINNTQCVSKSYPNFVHSFQKLGARIEQHEIHYTLKATTGAFDGQ